MPLYDFECKTCDIAFERQCKIAEKDKTTCPKCGGDDVKQLIVPPTVILFHAGWYEHFTSEPIYIGSKRELKEACHKYNMGSAYLDDSC